MHHDPLTGPQAPQTAEQSDDDQRAGWRLSWWKRWQRLPWSGKLLLLLTACVILLIAYTALKPQQWIFSVQAQTRIVEITTPTDNETKWRIDGAILCVRGTPELPVDKFAPLERDDARCGGPRWAGYDLLDDEQTLVVRGQLKTIMERRDEGLVFAMRDLRRPASDSGDTAQVLLSFTDGKPDIVLSSGPRIRIHLIFPPTQGGAPSERVFPFVGETTIGRDVNWAGSSLLSAGSIEVYTADVTADKRKRIDKTELLLGDQVRLAATRRAGMPVYPKGFVRSASSAKSLDVIAFGAADHVRIERFGDNGYDLKPSLLLQVLNDTLLLLVTSFFVAAVGLITGLASVIQIDEHP